MILNADNYRTSSGVEILRYQSVKKIICSRGIEGRDTYYIESKYGTIASLCSYSNAMQFILPLSASKIYIRHFWANTTEWENRTVDIQTV